VTPENQPARSWSAPAIAFAIVLALGLSIIDALPVGVMYDDGMYVILAKAIATGHGLHWLQLPGSPAAVHFPPGYPAVLALLWWLYPHFPANVILFKMAGALFLAASAAGVALFAQRRLAWSSWSAGALAVATTIGVPTLVLSAHVMSEPLFLALLLPTLLLAERVAQPDDTANSVAACIALGVAVGLLSLVRSNGIALAAGVGLVLLLRHRVRAMLVFAASTAFVLAPWQLWVHAHRDAISPAMGGNYESYTTWLLNGFRELGPALAVRTIAATSRESAGMIVAMTAPSAVHALQLIALALVLLFAAVGVRRLWAIAPVTAAFIGFYLLIVVLWPFTPIRFLWAIWPLLVLMPVLGVLQALAWRPTRRVLRAVRYLALVCACAVAVGYGRFNVNAYRGRWWSSIALSNAQVARPLVRWVAANTPPNAIVASEVESMMYLYAGRQAVPVSKFTVFDYFRSPTESESARALRDIMHAYPVSVIAVAPGDSLRASLRALSSGPSPELVLRDTVPNGLLLVPSSR
jgi:hypothetical protein